METLEDLAEQARKKQKTSTECLLSYLDEAIAALTDLDSRLTKGATCNATSVLDKLPGKDLAERKDLHSTLSKLSKAVDKSTIPDLDIVIQDPPPDEPINNLILLHFISKRQFDLAATFAKEANLELPDDYKAHVETIADFTEVITSGDLQPCLQWCKANQVRLQELGSNFYFELHQLLYLQLLRDDRVHEALQFAQTHFPHFQSDHAEEIKHLLGLLAFKPRGGLSHPFYTDLQDVASLLDEKHPSRDPPISQLAAQFAKLYCACVGIAEDSLLHTCILAGAQSLATVHKIIKISPGKQKMELKAGITNMLESALTDDLQFHSVFICPVSREEATEDNPPMLLDCGHVICRMSLERLESGQKGLKCPYCPRHCSAESALELLL